jgi:hypothetical protein
MVKIKHKSHSQTMPAVRSVTRATEVAFLPSDQCRLGKVPLQSRTTKIDFLVSPVFALFLPLVSPSVRRKSYPLFRH